jgi:hypothetical protein
MRLSATRCLSKRITHEWAMAYRPSNRTGNIMKQISLTTEAHSNAPLRPLWCRGGRPTTKMPPMLCFRRLYGLRLDTCQKAGRANRIVFYFTLMRGDEKSRRASWPGLMWGFGPTPPICVHFPTGPTEKSKLIA